MTCSKTRLYKTVIKQLKANGYEGDYLDDVKKNLIIVYKALKFPTIDFNITSLSQAVIWDATPQGYIYWDSVCRKTVEVHNA